MNKYKDTFHYSNKLVTCDGSLIAKILFRFKDMLMSNPVPFLFLPYGVDGKGGNSCLL